MSLLAPAEIERAEARRAGTTLLRRGFEASSWPTYLLGVVVGTVLVAAVLVLVGR